MVSFLFFDSYAIIELLNGNPDYRKYSGETIIATSLNLGEVYSAYLRKGRERVFFRAVDRLGIEILPLTTEDCYRAMRFRYENRTKNYSYVDSIGYTLARHREMTFLTGDKDFRGVAGVEWVK